MVEKLKSYYNVRGLQILLIVVGVIATIALLFNGISAWASYRSVHNKLEPFAVASTAAKSTNKESLASSAPLQKKVADMYFMEVKDAAPQFRAQLIGILGNEAFFNGQDSPKVLGDQINGATIKEVNADSVVVDFNGKQVTLNVFNDAGGGGGMGGPGGDMGGGPGRFMRGGMGGPGGGGGFRAGGFGAMMSGGEMTPEAIQQMADSMRSRTPEEQEYMISRVERRDPNAAAKLREALGSAGGNSGGNP